MMRLLLGLSHRLSLLALATLLSIVAASVIGRAIFDLSGGTLGTLVPGAIELATYSLMIMVFAALPRAALAGMVRVDILIDRLPDRIAQPLEVAWRTLTALFGALLTWLLATETRSQALRGDVTQDLEMPLWIFTGAAALGAFALCLTVVIFIFDQTQTAR